MHRKGQLNLNLLWGVIGLASVIVVAGLFIAFGADITDDIQDDFITGAAGCNSTDVTGCGHAYNITGNALEATETLSERQDTIAQIGIVVIIIGLLMGVVAFVGMRQ